MPTVARVIDAPPEQVFGVLAEGWLYATWVVGASQIRDVDAGWPAVGTKIHHCVGAWPILIKDETEVLEVDAGVRLVLSTKARPLGLAQVTLDLAPEGAGTKVTMEEHPTGGPGKWLHNPVHEKILQLRNKEALARLASIAENRRQER